MFLVEYTGIYFRHAADWLSRGTPYSIPITEISPDISMGCMCLIEVYIIKVVLEFIDSPGQPIIFS